MLTTTTSPRDQFHDLLTRAVADYASVTPEELGAAYRAYLTAELQDPDRAHLLRASAPGLRTWSRAMGGLDVLYPMLADMVTGDNAETWTDVHIGQTIGHASLIARQELPDGCDLWNVNPLVLGGDKVVADLDIFYNLHGPTSLDDALAIRAPGEVPSLSSLTEEDLTARSSDWSDEHTARRGRILASLSAADVRQNRDVVARLLASVPQGIRLAVLSTSLRAGDEKLSSALTRSMADAIRMLAARIS